jgi:precorrin-6A/cobalt-precorrin-6A reductase
MPVPERILILGGTGEAAALARALAARFGDALAVTTSLAGRTREPTQVPGGLRVGGFGGPEGLADYLRSARIELLVDATHPFAAQISRHARLAAQATGTERLLLSRPSWKPEAGDRWIEAADMNSAAALLPRLGRCVFITTGARELDAFAALSDLHFVVRLIAPPRAPLALAAELVIARPPFALDDERNLLQRHAIDVVVAKASGGARPEKLEAARAVGLPVVMISRPPPEPGPAVASVEDAVEWIAAWVEAD